MLEQQTATRCQQLSGSDPWKRVAQAALMLLLLMILISPITQNIWKGDNFLHGHDTETSLVLGLTLASVAILRMQRSRSYIIEMFKRVRDALSSLFGAWLLWYLAGRSHYSFRPIARVRNRGRPIDFAGYQLPLLI